MAGSTAGDTAAIVTHVNKVITLFGKFTGAILAAMKLASEEGRAEGMGAVTERMRSEPGGEGALERMRLGIDDRRGGSEPHSERFYEELRGHLN